MGLLDAIKLDLEKFRIKFKKEKNLVVGNLTIRLGLLSVDEEDCVNRYVYGNRLEDKEIEKRVGTILAIKIPVVALAIKQINEVQFDDKKPDDIVEDGKTRFEIMRNFLNLVSVNVVNEIYLKYMDLVKEIEEELSKEMKVEVIKITPKKERKKVELREIKDEDEKEEG